MINHEFKVYTSQKNDKPGEHKGPLYEPQLIAVVGGTGQGKSNLLINLKEAWKKDHPKYGAIIMYNGSESDSSIQYYKKDSTVYVSTQREKFIQDIVSFEQEVRKDIVEIGDKHRQRYKDEFQTLIILDDIGAESFVKSSFFEKLYTTHRHIMTTIVLSVQKYTMLPTVFRTNLNILFIYPSTMSGTEKNQILKDLPFTKTSIEDAVRSISAPYDFLTFNKTKNSIYKNFSIPIISPDLQ